MPEKPNLVFAAYCVAGGLADITPEQARRLTHLNIAFGVVRDNRIDASAIRQHRFYLDQLRRVNPDLQVLISTGGGGAGGHGEATSPEHLEDFVRSTMDAVREFGLDGIDCDWEFPCDSGNLAERQQHVALMRAYRRELDRYERERGGKKCWLTIAAAAWDKYLDNTDVAEVVKVLDFINLMTYDLRDRSWAENYTGHHTNLYPPRDAFYPDSVAGCVEKYRALGIPCDKLVIGAAFYSRRWDGVPDARHGMNQKVDTPCVYGPSYTAIRLVYERGGAYVKYWDDDAKAPWLFNGVSFITYDDPMSMAHKAAYVRQTGLRGLMYWEHSYDLTGELFNALYEGLFVDQG